MVKFIILMGCLGVGYCHAEEASTLDKLKTFGQDSVNKLKESSNVSTETKVAEFTNNTYSTKVDIFCNTKAYTQGHKFISGVGCHIEYKFFAKKVYEGEELIGHILPNESEDDCDKAIAICKYTQFTFKEVNENIVDIFYKNKIVGSVDFSKEVPGFVPSP